MLLFIFFDGKFTFLIIIFFELTNKTFKKADIENKLKLIFEKNLSKMYKIDNRSNNKKCIYLVI